MDASSVDGYILGMDDIDLDARGLLCPLPVLKLRKRLEPLATGHELRMLADDEMARIDIPHFCTEQGHVLVKVHNIDGAQLYVIRKG